MKDNKEERLERIKSQKVLSNNPKNVNGEVNNLIKEMEHKNDEIKQIRNHINEQIGQLESLKKKDEHSKNKIYSIKESIKDMQAKLSDLDAEGIPKHIMSELKQTNEL